MDFPTFFHCGLWDLCVLASTLFSLSLTCQLHWVVKVSGLACPVGPAEKSWKRNISQMQLWEPLSPKKHAKLKAHWCIGAKVAKPSKVI